MARPRTEVEAQRNERLNLRLTAGERMTITANAAFHGFKSVSDFARHCALGKRMPAGRMDKEAHAARSTALIRLGTNATQIGNNLNQIARHMNAGRGAPQDLVETIAAVADLASRVNGELDRLMIPRLSDLGTSFKGAAAYYLADKREEGEAVRITSDRVAWTYTLNLPTDDPDRAWRMMAHTALAHAELKAAAGIKATGRKLTKPVMAYSLAWSPDEDPPAPHEMLEAAQASLAFLGLEQHQALIVCHNDTAHPHVHVIVNRVNPDNGVAHTGSRSKLKLSEWAEAYEKSRGRILCVERVENNSRRRDSQKVDRAEKVSRPHWEAAGVDQARAGSVAEIFAEDFGDQAAIERAGQQRRKDEAMAFHARRRAGRNAIRARYQAVIDTVGRPQLTARRAIIADALVRRDPALALADLTRDRATFTRQDLVRHIGRHTATVEEFEAVLARLENSSELVALGRDDRGRSRFTTRSHQAIEQRMQNHARSLYAAPKLAVRALWPKGLALSKDQDAALRHVVGAGGLTAIVGYAGTGKSTMLGAARRSWEAAGLAVQGMTLSGIAADGLKNGSGIESRTIHSRLAQWEGGKNLPKSKDVIVIDEAGMIGSRQMERILHFAQQGMAKVVLVGDPEQLQAIEAGGAFRALADRFGAARLDTVRRQRADWQQEATRELATSQTDHALHRYEQAGMVHEHKTRDAAKAALIDRWSKVRAAQPDATQIILAYTRDEVRDLNARARADLRKAGDLGLDVTLQTETGRKAFATGDRIYFLKNDAGLGVRNGTLATIVKIKDRNLVVRFDGSERRLLMFSLDSYGHIDHGYAATIHKSQGVTVDRAHLLATKNLDRHASYVAMTRHRDRLDLHWSEDTFAGRAKLVRGMSREGLKDTSLDYGEAVPDVGSDRRTTLDRLRKSIKPTEIATPTPVLSDKAKLETAERDARQQHRGEAIIRRLLEPDPIPIEPRIEQTLRSTVLLTAEMMAYDSETITFAEGMETRHEAERSAEERSRERLTAAAALKWHDAARQPIEPELEDPLDTVFRQGHGKPSGPKPS